MTNFEVTNHLDRDEWDEDEYVEMGIVATIQHHKGKAEDDDENRDAIVVGNDVLIIEPTDE